MLHILNVALRLCRRLDYAEVNSESITGPQNKPASPWKVADSSRMCCYELAFPWLLDQQWSGESSFVEPPSLLPVSHTVLSVLP